MGASGFNSLGSCLFIAHACHKTSFFVFRRRPAHSGSNRSEHKTHVRMGGAAEKQKANQGLAVMAINRQPLTGFGDERQRLRRRNRTRPRLCEFARRVAAVEKLKATQRASLVELDALFASLQHRAFRGEL